MERARDCSSGGWPMSTRLWEWGKSSKSRRSLRRQSAGHEVGVVDDGDEHFAGAMDLEGFLDQQPFAPMVAAFELDLEGFAEDAQGVVVGVEGAVDDRGDEALGVVVEEGLFEDALAGARFAQHQAQAALLGVDAEDVEDFLLVRQQRDGFRRRTVGVGGRSGSGS